MRRIVSMFLILVLAFACITPVYAADLTLPELPIFAFEDPYADDFVQHSMVLKVGSEYYAVLYSNSSAQIRNDVKCVGDSNAFSLKFGRAVRYVYTYQLVDGTWTLIYETSSVTDANVTETIIYPDSPIVYTDWQDSYNADELLVYSDGGVELTFWYGFYSADGKKVMTSSDVEFVPPDVGGSDDTEDSGDSWGEEDKGWLGSLFSDLKDLWNNLYSRFVSVLENLISSLTSSVGNFISSATTSISGFIDSVISVIDAVKTSVGEWIAGVVSEIQAIYTGITDFLVSLWSDMWTAISEFFENLFKDITDYFAEKKAEAEAISDVFTSFFDALGTLFGTIFGYDYQSAGGAVEDA